MNISQMLKILLTAGCFACLVDSAVAYDPTWSRSDCATYSYHGLHERYVRGGNKGWIDNDRWDSSDVEGVDCSSYVSRCLALPYYVPEGDTAPYPYDPDEFFYGLVDHMVRIYNIDDLQPWDVWVWMADHGGPSNEHTGLFVRFNGSDMVSREALNEQNGIVERSWRKQDMIDWGCRFFRRENWANGSSVVEPTVSTNAATNIQANSATLGGTITDNGGGAIDSRGFAWGTTSACDDGWVNGSTGTPFTATLNGLQPETRYYFQAQAHNSDGWGSGTVRSFTTDSAPSGTYVIIDNGNSGTSYTGTWGVSGGTGAYGSNSLWARDGATYTWRFTPPSAGTYEVYMWWTEYSSRGKAVPVSISHAVGTAKLTVDQKTNGSQWNLLGQYNFNSSGAVTLTAAGSYPTSHCADAVMFMQVEQTNQQPVAVIDSVSPQSAQVGQQVTMTGHGTDDGSITAYQWSSSRDGVLGSTATLITSSLSKGTHTISFRVCDNQDVWSDTVQETVTVTSPDVDEVIIDNGDSGTFYTGTWSVSGGTDPYGTNSLWARNGATYTWQTDNLASGNYEVFMWWTEFPSRSNKVSVQVQHADGTGSISVNQQTDGRQWNSLGQYAFSGTGSVTLFAPGAYPTSYCADAVKFLKVSSEPPSVLTADFAAYPLSGEAPLTVNFTDLSSPVDIIYAWRWDFDGDGSLDSSLQNPTFTFTKPGTYSIRQIVYANGSKDELTITNYIKVLQPSIVEEIIVDNGNAGTSSRGTWAVSGGADPYGANSLWARQTASYRWSFTPAQTGRYEVFLWWTEFNSRGTAIPVQIKHNSGTAGTTVNQQTNGGQWNALGTYRMTAGQSCYVEIATAGDNSTASADAIRVRWVSD